ncbi:ribonuclease HIII [Staphylococcus simulans]|uniref:ribonuclease HIII n=1 Tax=Staphylococcus simulans TaxID=1286 RepID=UPI000D1D4698|nr:ribonuclease HIII [Staphylococcus simulans]PTJ35859.1 ribonuclease HIII [Staphylococcus simulans]
MANVVLKLTEEQIQQLLSKINADTTNLPKGSRARAKYQGTTIHIYNSDKVMFQGTQAEAVSQQLLGNAVQTSKAPSKKKKTTIINSSDYPFNTSNCIGSDEAGSGDYFGPLTVCAAYVSKEHVKVLKTLGVDDSKKLSDDKIVELAEQLVTFLPHSLQTLDNKRYNEQKQLGWSQVKMKAVLHNHAIENVVDRIEAQNFPLDYIVIDQFAVRGVYQNYALTAMPYPDKTCFETKGESKSLAIAAASILSRYAFVKHMEHMGKKINQTIPKGASQTVDLFAARLIDQYGTETLDSISKADFKNRDKALDLYRKKQLNN